MHDKAQAKAPVNLRHRQKQNTRLQLMNTAMALFIREGYEQVTLNQIADQADIHVQTLYKHFKTKTALATSYFDLFIDRILAGINDYPGDSDVYRQWCQSALRQLERLMGAPENLAIFRMIHANEELLAHTQYRMRLVEDALCQAFIRQIEAGEKTALADEYEARLIAAQLITAFRDAHFSWIHSGGKTSSVKRFRKFLARIDKGLEQHRKG